MEREWGKFRLSKTKPLSLDFNPPGWAKNDPYEIELSRITGADGVLHWMNHFMEAHPSWFTFGDMRDFMKACASLMKQDKIKAEYPKDRREAWGY